MENFLVKLRIFFNHSLLNNVNFKICRHILTNNTYSEDAFIIKDAIRIGDLRCLSGNYDINNLIMGFCLQKVAKCGRNVIALETNWLQTVEQNVYSQVAKLKSDVIEKIIAPIHTGNHWWIVVIDAIK